MNRLKASPSRATLAQLRAVRDQVQGLLDRHHPGEKLSWPVTAAPQPIPAHCLRAIEAAGPALQEFFAAANRLFSEVAWLRPLLEKRYHPNYRRLNDAQPEALPWNPRPDIVPDADWNPKFVELELTIGGRSESALASQVFGLPPETTTVHLYAEALRRRGLSDRPLVLLSAFHPYYAELLDDAQCYASLLREAGANVVALSDADLAYLSYRDGRLRCLRPGGEFEFTHFDRFTDIFEIAELTHAGMRPLLEAYLDGVAIDVNTCKQFLDEKLWMALFWDPRLEKQWRRLLSEERWDQLRRLIPFTTYVSAETRVPLEGKWQPLMRLAEVSDDERLFCTKESGTSETAAAAQSFRALNTMTRDEVRQHLCRLVQHGPPSVLQELIESARVDFEAVYPDTGQRMSRRHARVKLTPFYVEGRLGDLRFVASNKGYAVHDEDYMETVVARPVPQFSGDGRGAPVSAEQRGMGPCVNRGLPSSSCSG